MKAFTFALSMALFWGVSLTPALSRVASHGHWHATTPPPSHGSHTPPKHGHAPGSAGPSGAQMFACNDGTIGLLNACGHVYADMFVMNGNAGVILPVTPFTFDSSNASAAFTFEDLEVFCPQNFAVVFQGTNKGTAATVSICVCNANSQRTGCENDSTQYTIDAQQFPQLNGLKVNSVIIVLYGGDGGGGASAYKFRFNSNPVVSGFNTSTVGCPTLPPNTCGGAN